jgi:hypothetical protein
MVTMSERSGQYTGGQEVAGGMYILMIQRGEPSRGVEMAMASIVASSRRRGRNITPGVRDVVVDQD